MPIPAPGAGEARLVHPVDGSRLDLESASDARPVCRHHGICHRMGDSVHARSTLTSSMAVVVPPPLVSLSPCRLPLPQSHLVIDSLKYFGSLNIHEQSFVL